MRSGIGCLRIFSGEVSHALVWRALRETPALQGSPRAQHAHRTLCDRLSWRRPWCRSLPRRSRCRPVYPLPRARTHLGKVTLPFALSIACRLTAVGGRRRSTNHGSALPLDPVEPVPRSGADFYRCEGPRGEGADGGATWIRLGLAGAVEPGRRCPRVRRVPPPHGHPNPHARPTGSGWST
jgi:hypothetical protein